MSRHAHPQHASSRPRRPLQDYLDALPGDALLTAEEERSLAEAIHAGDTAARARLIRCNLRLVVRIARDYQDRGLSLDDLVGEGNVGLIRAAEDYDPRFGTRFSTYAAYWIKQAIRHALTTTGATIRLPSHVVNLLTRWRRAERALTRQRGREPGFDEIADALDLNESHRELVARALSTRQILHESGGDGASSWSGEEVLDSAGSPEAELEAREERLDVLRRLDRLDDRERTVVTLRFGLNGADPLTLKEIGRRLGITREWVRKIEMRAVRKLDDHADPEPQPTPRRTARFPRSRQLAQIA